MKSVALSLAVFAGLGVASLPARAQPATAQPSASRPAASQPAADQSPGGVVHRLCRTREACRAEADKLASQPVRGATSALARDQDLFYWFGRINMASTVANVQLGIIPPELAGPIAR